MFKKLFMGIMAIVAVVAVAGTMTSCSVKAGTSIYEVDMKGFDDNMDILRNAIEKDFETLGFTREGDHYFILNGEVNSNNKKAAAIFQQCCKAVDKDRSKLSLPLALKGQTIALKGQLANEPSQEISTYTFVEEDK